MTAPKSYLGLFGGPVLFRLISSTALLMLLEFTSLTWNQNLIINSPSLCLSVAVNKDSRKHKGYANMGNVFFFLLDWVRASLTFL